MNITTHFTAALFSAAFLLSGCAPKQSLPIVTPPILIPQASTSSELFIGVSIVNDQTAWISGTNGTFGRTTDGGATWEIGQVAGADSLQFRDVHALNPRIAYLLSIGNGEQSRIYKTADAGFSWSLLYQNRHEKAFFDCMDFWDRDSGLAFSDSFDGSFLIIRTLTGGLGWESLPPSSLPPALEGEGSFAASGTCLVTQGDSTAFVVTGAGGKARFLSTRDRGETWSVVETPVTHGTPSSGLASVSFLDENRGVVAGGDMAAPDSTADTVAFTEDGGKTWKLAGRTTFPGAVYGISYVPNQPTPTLVAVGPRGIDFSVDNGANWRSLSKDNYWSVAFGENGIGWATGTDGKILRIEFR